MAVNVAVSLLPVFLFLGVLMYLDSYQLVKFRLVVFSILNGVAVCVACYFLNTALLNVLALEFPIYSQYIAPPLEEFFKAILPAVFIVRRRVGFMVDAAIFGFAVGAGFGFAENIFYLSNLQNADLVLWIIRGFGTAIMHGGVTAAFAILSKNLTDRHESMRLRHFIPGFILAVVVHSVYNHFFLSPLISTGVVMVALPLIVFAVYTQSEKLLEDWMELNLHNESELLKAIKAGEFSSSRAGRYLLSIKDRFDPMVVYDMYWLVYQHLELSIKAKGMLLLKQAGFETPGTDGIRKGLKELDFLETSIGKTGKLAILPFLRLSSKELWQLHLLEGAMSREKAEKAG